MRNLFIFSSMNARIFLSACSLVGAILVPAAGSQAVETAPEVIATIPVGSAPWGVAITPDGDRAFIGNSGQTTTNNVSVIDIASQSVIRQINTGRNGAAGVAITPDGSRVFVANYGPGSISIIDTTTYSDLVAPAGCVGPLSVTANPDGSNVYLACDSGYLIRIANSAGFANTTVIASSDGYFDVGMTSSALVYVGGSGGSGTANLLGSVSYAPLSGIGTAVALSPDESKAYVGDVTGNFYVIELSGWNSITATYPLGGDIRGIAITPDGTQAYVVDRTGNQVKVIDVTDGSVLYVIPVGSQPQRIAISPDGRTALVTNNGSNTVSVISIPARPEAATDSSVTYDSLNFSNAESLSCSVTSLRGVRGSWVKVPSENQCSVTNNSGDQLLGWSTYVGFPADIARRQVSNGWGAYEVFHPDGGVRGVFIPRGGFTHLTNSATLYPVLGVA